METPCRAIGTKVRGVRSIVRSRRNQRLDEKSRDRFLGAEILQGSLRMSEESASTVSNVSLRLDRRDGLNRGLNRVRNYESPRMETDCGKSIPRYFRNRFFFFLIYMTSRSNTTSQLTPQFYTSS